MATFLRVRLATCVVFFILLEVSLAFGVGRHDAERHDAIERGRNIDLEDVKHRVRRGALADQEQPPAGNAGVGGGIARGGRGMDMLQRGRGAGVVPGNDADNQFGRRRDMRDDLQMQQQMQPNRFGAMNAGPARMPNDQGRFQQQQGQPQAQGGFNAQMQFPQAQGVGGQGLRVNMDQNPNFRQQPPQLPDPQTRKDAKKQPPARQTPMRPIRIADHPACAADVQHMCARKGNNFAVLDCLQKGENDISPDCNHFLWNYKMNLTKDYRFDNAASEVCREDLRKFSDCTGMEPGKGLILPCLLDHFDDIANQQCVQYLNRMKEITFSDFRLITGFYEQCSDDIATFKCGVVNEDGNAATNLHHSQGGTIHCLEKNIKKLGGKCKLQILRVAELSSRDYQEDRALFFACRDDRERFCPKEVSGQGRVYKCLLKNKFDKEMSEDCKEKLTTRQKVVAEDYKANFRLMRKCKKEVAEAACSLGDAKTKEMKLANILLCLERGSKEKTVTISGECQAELVDVRKEIMSDYMINPELMESCAVEIEADCNGVRREGKTIHCLMGLAKRNKLSDKCKKGLSDLVEEADAGSDYRLDPALHEACKPVRDALCPKKSDSEVLQCLMDNIDDNQMKDVCAEKLLEIQYFISRNFRLDPVLYKNCQSDAKVLCYTENWTASNNVPAGIVFSCLHGHLHNEESPLQPRCADQIHRVLRQRAVSVHLNPRIEENCRMDLGLHCSDKVKRGEELQCLQDNVNDLTDQCKQAVGNFTIEEAEDIQMNRKLISACAPMLRRFCQDKLKAKKVDEGEALRCLIENKNNDEMEVKCQASIEHFQLLQLKDYRFSFKFKESCRKDVLKLCKGSRDKSSIIKCLSSKVRDSILLSQAPPVTEECRQQLKFELLQRDENIELDPELQKVCKSEIRRFCSTVTQGNARVIECLRSHQADLDNDCHVKLFNREKEMAAKPDIDYALMHSCKKSIKTKCKDASPDTMIDCLKSHKDDPDMEQKCKVVLTKRQIERNSNIQLNPALRKSCKLDINKFCRDEMSAQEGKANPAEMEGKVIQCLRSEFQKRQSKLSPSCARHIGAVIKEGAEDYRLDPMLNKYCLDAINERCSEEKENPGSGRVEECLKMNLQYISDAKCRQQVIQLFREGLADVHVDPLLYKACALDIKHYCVGIPQGQGQQMSCLLETLDDKTVRLQPDCRRMLAERKEMWEFAAKVAPAEDFLDIFNQIRNSPSHNYFMLVIVSFIGMLFFCGLCCGRATKRVRQELKNK
ncbi:Golgi apparatus protein 1-like [Diadema antillarum]|uniref:Golgi apparatus protein 1-like n=1 Tax=Diadema antillarum TaxID=105358 RepID=UPI003A8863EF